MLANLYSLIKIQKIKSDYFYFNFTFHSSLLPFFLTVITQNRAIRFAKKEMAGVVYNRLLIDLIKDYRNAIATLNKYSSTKLF